jgi:hypothetical protein
MTFHEVNTRIDQSMEHDIHRGRFGMEHDIRRDRFGRGVFTEIESH